MHYYSMHALHMHTCFTGGMSSLNYSLTRTYTVSHKIKQFLVTTSSPQKRSQLSHRSLAPPYSQLGLRVNIKGQLRRNWATIATSNIHWAAETHNVLSVGLKYNPLCQPIEIIWQCFRRCDTHWAQYERWLYIILLTTKSYSFFMGRYKQMKTTQIEHHEHGHFHLLSTLFTPMEEGNKSTMMWDSNQVCRLTNFSSRHQGEGNQHPEVSASAPWAAPHLLTGVSKAKGKNISTVSTSTLHF